MRTCQLLGPLILAALFLSACEKTEGNSVLMSETKEKFCDVYVNGKKCGLEVRAWLECILKQPPCIARENDGIAKLLGKSDLHIEVDQGGITQEYSIWMSRGILTKGVYEDVWMSVMMGRDFEYWSYDVSADQKLREILDQIGIQVPNTDTDRTPEN